ncbi:hypothetical protein CUMW_189630 [Citrus unshiu]|uniref:Uncharacterized protein n=1 Tax=Citrus unshiu TaxID=55188 RepID=A0A2H5Q2I8_CITUN|nr:hypothetical protein CUMW_189630 [Citrus unshiu]
MSKWLNDSNLKIKNSKKYMLKFYNNYM